MRQEKEIVKEFYEKYGWTRSESGVYKDTAAFVDTRPVMRSYQGRAMSRLARRFARGGAFFLDAGCGALASDDYVAIGSGYERRVCVDFSGSALREARKKLGRTAMCVTADIAALPFRGDVFDGVLCAHVLYHLPPDEQAPAAGELRRVLRRDGVAVIVYTWSTCLMTQIALLLNPRKVLPRIPGMRWVWRAFFKPSGDHAASGASAQVEAPPSLYFQPQDYAWYRDSVAKQGATALSCWQSISLPFSQAFIFDGKCGALLLRALAGLEAWFPALMGRIGAYPVFILRK